MSKNNISLNDFTEIEKVFNLNNWEIESGNDIRISLFNRFVDRYKRIELETRPLFLELSTKFLRITEKEIYKVFKEAYHEIYPDFLEGFDKIYIFPLVRPYIEVNGEEKLISRPKVKSGEKIKIFIQANEYRELKFSERILMPDTVDELSSKFDLDKDLLILVDDFIGSGETAVEVLEIIFDIPNFNCSNTIVLSLVSQQEGVDFIYNQTKVMSFFKHLRKKAITDFYLDTNIEANKNLVKQMGKKIKCSERYLLGYNDTEALVSIMNKSPNNTLGVFWHETPKLIAPFPRYINYK